MPCSAVGRPTGWAALAESVRAYDEEKVKDTKEDIDTLLVFVRDGFIFAVCVELIVRSQVCSQRYLLRS